MPRTEAGRRLLDNSAAWTHMRDTARYEATDALIAAIEAEVANSVVAAWEPIVDRAVAAERKRIKKAVERLAMPEREDIDPEYVNVIWQRNDVVARVLAIIDGADDA